MAEILKTHSIDLVILDLDLPGQDGLELVLGLRAESDIGIIILTGRGELTDRVVGLEIGADDYLTKPTSLLELLARVRSVLRRQAAAQAKRVPIAPNQARFADWSLDFRTRKLTASDGKDRNPAEDLEQCRLARTIASDNTNNIAALDFE